MIRLGGILLASSNPPLYFLALQTHTEQSNTTRNTQTNSKAQQPKSKNKTQVTKVSTGAAIMRHVDQGTVSLDDMAHVYIDPILKTLPGVNFTSLAALFGPVYFRAGSFGLRCRSVVPAR